MKVDVETEFEPIIDNPSKKLMLALFATKNQMLDDANRYIKVDTRNMMLSGRAELEGMDTVSLIWDTEYAEYAYDRGKPNKQNPWTGARASLRWAEVAEGVYRNDWIRMIMKGLL